jgi:hypothetical protein
MLSGVECQRFFAVRLRTVRRVAFFAGAAFFARFLVARFLVAFFVARFFAAFLAGRFLAAFLTVFLAALRVVFFAVDLRLAGAFRFAGAFFAAFRFAGAFLAVFLALAFFAGGTGTTFLESSRVRGTFELRITRYAG